MRSTWPQDRNGNTLVRFQKGKSISGDKRLSETGETPNKDIPSIRYRRSTDFPKNISKI